MHDTARTAAALARDVRRPRRPTVAALVAVGLLAAGCGDADGARPAAVEDGPAPVDVGDEPTTSSPTTSTVTWLDGEVPDLHVSVDGYATGTVTLAPPDDELTHVLPVRVAATGPERRHGLMEVPDVPDGTGMAFLYGSDREGGFWMKDTLVALDIVYVRADGGVADVRGMEPCVTDECPTYPPDEPYRWTLEVAAGFLDRIGLDESWRLAIDTSVVPTGG